MWPHQERQAKAEVEAEMAFEQHKAESSLDNHKKFAGTIADLDAEDLDGSAMAEC